MSEDKRQGKHVNFAIPEQRDEVESVLRELAPMMPPKDRGVLVRGIIWSVRHVKTMADDLEAMRDQVKTMEDKTEKELTSMRSKLRKAESERDEAMRELTEEREKVSQPQLTPSPRTIEEAKRLIREKKCPICGGQLSEWKGNDGKERVTCKDCRFFVWGTLDKPQIAR